MNAPPDPDKPKPDADEVGRAPSPAPRFEHRITPIPAPLREFMTGRSWRPECPIGLDDLALLELPYWDFDGQVARGQLVVAKAVADELAAIFARLFEARFPIRKMRLVDHYGASDPASMADDNTSAFNCRPVTGGTHWSQHAYGIAIDLNPVENPYLRGARVDPPNGAPFVDRSKPRKGMILEGDAATRAFDSLGWHWGGRWPTKKDYQHFSKNDR